MLNNDQSKTLERQAIVAALFRLRDPLRTMKEGIFQVERLKPAEPTEDDNSSSVG